VKWVCRMQLQVSVVMMLNRPARDRMQNPHNPEGSIEPGGGGGGGREREREGGKDNRDPQDLGIPNN
jgi:hypothetical protein